jgi:hypothetical protein
MTADRGMRIGHPTDVSPTDGVGARVKIGHVTDARAHGRVSP